MECVQNRKNCFPSAAHGGGRVVSASVSKTSASSSTPASAIIYDACTSIINKKKNKLFKILEVAFISPVKVATERTAKQYCKERKKQSEFNKAR